jgi:IclR family pca regulon transcriptional regulator
LLAQPPFAPLRCGSRPLQGPPSKRKFLAVLLAHLSPEELQDHLSKKRYRPLTANTITTISELTKAINQVAKDGYALVDQELEMGLRSLSVPVTNQQGSVIAAMNVGVSASRISNAHMWKNILPVLRNAGKLLGKQISL